MPGALTAVGVFEVEPGTVQAGSDTACYYDSIGIGTLRFCGTTGPDRVQVAAGSTFTWSSDVSNTNPGWTICLSEPHRPVAPMPPPCTLQAPLARIADPRLRF